MFLIFQHALCFVASARAGLLSALACFRNDNPISSITAFAKIKSTVHQEHTVLITPLDKATVPCPFHSLGDEKLVNGQGMCSLSSHGLQPNQRRNVP